jgi:disulfide bond formation protein DsbB
MTQTLRNFGLYLAWLVSIIATGGSLYFSEVMQFVPCNLCWWQRILMYPLVLLLGVASYTNDRGVARYALPLSIMGMGVSTYHYLGQKVPGFLPPSVCRGGVPCSGEYINWLGFITIPLLAFTAFTLITVILSVKAAADRKSLQAVAAA